MRKIFFLPFIFVIQLGFLQAQYVNTDSLLIVEGEELPFLLYEYDSLYLLSPETDTFPGYLFVFGQHITAGELISWFKIPCNGKVISRFGPRSGRMHTGTDIKMNKGDTAYASFSGVVTRSRYYYGYGNMVVIDHGNYLETYYSHLSGYLTKTGETVKTGDPVGLAGSSGRATTNHLHFEIRENNKPYDPELVFNFESGEVRKVVAEMDNLAELQKELKPIGYSVNQATPQIYRVRYGDSLWKISRWYRTSINAICGLNNITENTVLQIGQALKLY